MSDTNRKGFGNAVKSDAKAPDGKIHAVVDKAVGGTSEHMKGRMEEPERTVAKDRSTVERKR